MKDKLIVSSSPHLRRNTSTQKIMLDVIIAMIPAAIASIVFFGYWAAITLAVAIASCVLSEFVCRLVMKREQTVGDLSAIVTGMLLAFNLPANINPLITAFGGVIAIVVAKQIFGGLGQNFVNPALTARIVLMVSFPVHMTTWATPFFYTGSVDAMTTATPLGIIAEGSGTMPSYLDMFLGNIGGSMGETSALAILLGGIYLIARRVINPIVPFAYIGTVAAISGIACAVTGRDVLVDILSGGLMLGAFFMATDYATTPINWRGKLVFAIGCGFITMLIRLFGSLPEGVSYSIVLMNILTPHIESLTRSKTFGFIKARKERKRSEV